MDPLSAISVAAAVVQFVDFSSRLLMDTVEIFRSSANQPGNRDNIDISEISRDLSALSDEVQSQYRLVGIPPNGGSEEVFVRLCATCKAIGEELEGCVADVKIHIANNPTRAIRSFLIAL